MYFFLYMFFLLYLPQLTVLCYWCQCLYLITRLLQALNESLKMQIFNATMHSSNYNINSCYLLLTWLCEEWDVTYESLQSYGQVFFSRKLIWNKNSGTLKKVKLFSTIVILCFFHIQEVTVFEIISSFDRLTNNVSTITLSHMCANG